MDDILPPVNRLLSNEDGVEVEIKDDVITPTICRRYHILFPHDFPRFGASAIHIARTYIGRKRNFVGQHFWARGYFASTVGRDEQVIRDYIRHQEAEDRRIDQLELV